MDHKAGAIECEEYAIIFKYLLIYIVITLEVLLHELLPMQISGSSAESTSACSYDHAASTYGS